MTKGLRCPNCDSTIHRKTVHDWIVNKKASFLNCKNTFCNTRWKRSVLEEHASEFSGVEKPEPPPKPTPVERPAERITPKTVFKKVKRPAVWKSETWADRIRHVARQYASINGEVCIDDLRVWADINHMQPPTSSSWGSVFQGNEWNKVSRKCSSYAKSRSRQVSVWALDPSHKVTV